MLLPSLVGWVIGVAWRTELLPGLSPSSHGFRVPAWMVGERERRVPGLGVAGGAERERYEDLRRRLEGEVAASTSAEAGAGQSGSGSGQRFRGGNGNGNGNQGIMERLRGAF